MKKNTIYMLVLSCVISGLVSVFSYKKPPFLTVVGSAKMADGLGRLCPDLIEALQDDFDIGFIPIEKTDETDINEPLLSVIKSPNYDQGKVVFYSNAPWKPSLEKSSNSVARLFKNQKNKNQIRICYTMLESTEIPKEWVERLNDYFDLVAVPDAYLEEVFKNCGVVIPIFTVPLGLNLESFLREPIKQFYNDKFRFGCLGSLQDRKNQIKLAIAFDRAFNKDPNIELLIHARYAQPNYKKEFFDVMEQLNNSMIIYEEDASNNEEYLKKFKAIDMLVNISKGEGFSIQPREAMALGIPCIISNNTAQITLIKDAHVIPLNTTIKNPCYYSNLKCFAGDNFDFEIEELATVLKNAYNQKDDYLNYSSQNKNYAEKFNSKSMKIFYYNIIAPKNIKLGNKNIITQDGMETTSQKLMEKYKKLTGIKL